VQLPWEHDVLTTLAVAAREVEDIGLATGVQPIQGRHPMVLAQAALTLNLIASGRFTLGIGLTHQIISDGMWGIPWDRPVRRLDEYLDGLLPLLAGEHVDASGQTFTTRGQVRVPGAAAPPVYLAAMGPQILRLAGELADGVTPNWSSPEQIAWLREHVVLGAARAGRQAADIPVAHYIRVCIDQDEDAARRAFASNMLGYAMARPGQPKDRGYRAHFGRMGFDEVLSGLEARRDAGASLGDLVDGVPPELALRVGYFGRPAGAADALQKLSRGLDEAMVRLISVRRGDLEACRTAIRACAPASWRAAAPA
jgi:alkanesulfonate monooxygenase SsuD/methylene tetrahydromethanopterin reductase-like flavin-dependent oxidoreductase (luciferase family)